MGRPGRRSRHRHSLRQLQRNGLARIALAENTGKNSAKATYLSQCAICHGEKFAGSPPAFPSLVNVGARLPPGQIAATIKSGKGRMPGFPNLSADQLQGLVDFLTGAESKEVASSTAAASRNELSLHRLSQIPRSRRLSRHRSTMGNAQRHRPQYRRVRLENSISANIPNSPLKA